MLKQFIKLKPAILYKQVFKSFVCADILKFKPKTSFLSDADINSLFFGVVNLIKTNAYKKAELKFKREVNYYQDLLNLNLSRVVKLEHEIKKLKEKQI